MMTSCLDVATLRYWKTETSPPQARIFATTQSAINLAEAKKATAWRRQDRRTQMAKEQNHVPSSGTSVVRGR